MAPEPRTRFVETGDGRRLRVQVAGESDRVVLALLGTPNAGVLFGPWVRDAAARGLSLVTYDRPGYGGSTAHPGRNVADCARDVRAIAAALRFARCAAWGFSGGGPHALACAALAGDLVTAVATIGSPAPRNAPGLDYFAGMPDETCEDVELLRADRARWTQLSAEQRETALGMSAEQLVESWSAGRGHADWVALHGDFGAWLHRARCTRA